VKAVLVVLVLVTAVPHRIAFVVFGEPVPAAWLVIAAEVLAAAAAGWLAVRAVRRFRSAPWLRAAFPAGGWR
jgi:hypothetical protein